MKKGRPKRKDKNLKQENIDAYERSEKRRGPALCSGCGALFQNGRWSWKKAPAGAREDICPACRRIADNYPAGYIELKGPFFMEHKEEIMNLIRNGEEAQKKSRPLERIIAIVKEENQTIVTTTGIHLARRIGESLSRAYQGKLAFRYGDSEKSIRVSWSR